MSDKNGVGNIGRRSHRSVWITVNQVLSPTVGDLVGEPVSSSGAAYNPAAGCIGRRGLGNGR